MPRFIIQALAASMKYWMRRRWCTVKAPFSVFFAARLVSFIVVSVPENHCFETKKKSNCSHFSRTPTEGEILSGSVTLTKISSFKIDPLIWKKGGVFLV